MGLSDEQQHVVHCVQCRTQGNFIVLNGGAGTGKSHVVNEIRRKIPNVLLACPTGKAASLIGASTINRAFGVPLGVLDPRVPVQRLRWRDRSTRYFKGAEVLRCCSWIILDEYSMIRCDTFDFINNAMQQARKDTTGGDLPFGGAGVLLVGDSGQIPPVVTNSDYPKLRKLGYEEPFGVSESLIWQEL